MKYIPLDQIFHDNIRAEIVVDKRKLKKHIFQLKLDGTYDAIVRHAYMVGFAQGHKFGKTMGNLLPSDIEEAFDEYIQDYNFALEEDEEGQKPT